MPDSAELHTPEELLAGALALLAETDQQLMRAAVLEATTALEAYVSRTVFGVLDTIPDPRLAKWLKEKTRSDFDTRLSVLLPVATGLKIDSASDLWNRYKRGRTIRNRVTHAGLRVSRQEALDVVTNAREWLAWLQPTASSRPV
jgi:hypothetical protein